MYMPNREARISALKRYISLLEQEKKRLTLMISSGTFSIYTRTRAITESGKITEKLTRAEDELQRVNGGLGT
jgi:hypothetical protein